MLEEIAKVNKASDPEEQLVKLGGLLETVKGITGLGGEEEKAPSSGNAFFDSIMANVGKIAEVVPHITQAVTAKAQADAAAHQAGHHGYIQHPGMERPPQMQQAQPQMLQASQQAQQRTTPEEGVDPQRRVVRRRPAPQKKGKVPREELDNAVVFINSALESNPDLKPEDFANMAISSVDNDMLRRLSRQKSELVVDELVRMGVLHGQVSTEGGQAWLCKLLDVLRERL
jgi:hypothetical protein